MSDRTPERLDPEELAAYLDGRLTGRRQARVEEVLAREGDDYEIFLSSAAFLQQERRPREAEVVRPARWGPRHLLYVAVPLAAAALLALLIGLPGGEPKGPKGPRVADLAFDLAPGTDLDRLLGEGWLDPGWPGQRGPVHALSPEQRVFRLGVSAVDLDVALRAGALESAQVVAKRIVDLAAAEELVTVASTYRALVARLADVAKLTDVPQEELLELAARGESFLEEDIGSARFSLARWSEAGRLAVLAGDPSPFARPAFRDFLEQLPEDAVDEQTRSLLGELRQLLAAEEPELAALRQAFATLVKNG